MFRSIRLKRRAVTLLSLTAVAVIIALCLLLLRAGAPDTVDVGGAAYPLSVSGDAEIEVFLTACGCAPEGCVSDRAITVPKHWSDVYTAYNDLQLAQGLTLVPYKGRVARELVYALADGGYATVLVSDGRIIAAHRGTMIYGDSLKPLIQV